MTHKETAYVIVKENGYYWCWNLQYKDNKIEELQSQLAEKETRIAELEDKDWYETTIKQLEKQNGRLIEQLAEKEKEQNAKAIEQLKKVDTFIISDDCYDLGDVRIEIDNQINELKGDK